MNPLFYYLHVALNVEAIFFAYSETETHTHAQVFMSQQRHYTDCMLLKRLQNNSYKLVLSETPRVIPSVEFIIQTA